MPSTKDIRRRIKSIKSTHQITKAMELVAGAKMRKAQQQALSARTYAALAWELIQNLSKQTDREAHKLLRERAASKSTAALLITSNRGLIGGFNNNIVNAALNFAKDAGPVEFITLGKKGRDAVRKRGFLIAGEFEKKDTVASEGDIHAVAKLLIEDFINGKYERVVIVYMDYISTLVQKPRVKQLLPLLQPPAPTLQPTDYLFEPTADLVLEVLLPRLTAMQIYQAVLETNAAEHSARMVAMKNASDAASDLALELTGEYNQLRQAAVTKEISEIMAGQLALA